MNETFKRWTACILTLCQLLLSCTFLLSPSYAQVPDTEPPEVGLDSVAESSRNENQIFTVTATDDGVITELSMFYRLGTEGGFVSEPMNRVGDTDVFTATIPVEQLAPSTRVIQYYFDARDAAGNRTLQGFSFDPLERSLTDAPAVSANSSSGTPVQGDDGGILGSLSTTEKVVYGALAVLVVGALVASASSGGDDTQETTENPDTETTPVTIFSEPLPGL